MNLLFRAELNEGHLYGRVPNITPAVMGTIQGMTTQEGYPINAFLIPSGKFKRWGMTSFFPIAYYHVYDQGVYEYYLIGIDAHNAPPTQMLPKYYEKIQKFFQRNFKIAGEGDGQAVDSLVDSFIDQGGED